jgi:hypothetical protein
MIAIFKNWLKLYVQFWVYHFELMRSHSLHHHQLIFGSDLRFAAALRYRPLITLKEKAPYQGG